VHIFLKHIINFVLLVKTIIAEAIDISWIMGNLDLDILWKSIFTLLLVQRLRFETQSTLQSANYHRIFHYTL
jgi:hypothetical protein